MTLMTLAEFDCALSDYILGNIRQYLVGLNKRPQVPKYRGPREYSEPKDFATWIASELAGDLTPLWDRIWSELSEDLEPKALSDSELFGLEDALRDLPPHLSRTCVWEPFVALHRRYVKSVPEIRALLTRQTAEEWARASMRFSKRLCKADLPLKTGVAIVREWLWYARELQNAVKDAKPRKRSDPASRSTQGKLSLGRHRNQPNQQGSTKAEASSNRTMPAVCDWKEAMVATGLKKTKLYSLFKSGILKGYKDGKMIRFYRAGLDDYMKQRENTGDNATVPSARRRTKKRVSPTRLKFL